MYKIKMKDKVKVITGKDKGKTGEVLKVFYDTNRAIVSKVNMVKKHKRPTQSDPGGIIEKEAALELSNIKLICSKCNATTRVKFGVLSDGKKVRICKKCGEMII